MASSGFETMIRMLCGELWTTTLPTAGGDDYDVGVRGVGVVVRAQDVGVALLDRHGFYQIQVFAFGDAFYYVGRPPFAVSPAVPPQVFEKQKPLAKWLRAASRGLRAYRLVIGETHEVPTRIKQPTMSASDRSQVRNQHIFRNLRRGL